MDNQIGPVEIRRVILTGPWEISRITGGITRIKVTGQAGIRIIKQVTTFHPTRKVTKAAIQFNNKAIRINIKGHSTTRAHNIIRIKTIMLIKDRTNIATKVSMEGSCRTNDHIIPKEPTRTNHIEEVVGDLADAQLEQRAAMEMLTKQLSQMATTLNEIRGNDGRLPATVKVPDKANISQITLRSGKEYAGPSKKDIDDEATQEERRMDRHESL